MLDDRKFYYAVGAKESPWKPAGEPAAVLMNPIEAFVGAHSPEVRLRGEKPGGLSQEGLALLSGKRYTGRIVLAGSPAAAPVRVALVWGDGPSERQTISIDNLTYVYRAYPLSFTAGAATGHGRLEIVGTGRGAFRDRREGDERTWKATRRRGGGDTGGPAVAFVEAAGDEHLVGGTDARKRVASSQ